VKTINEVVSVSTVFKVSVAPVMVDPNQGTQSSHACSVYARRIATFSRTNAINGTVHSAELK
jgi:hypothetical protein